MMISGIQHPSPQGAIASVRQKAVRFGQNNQPQREASASGEKTNPLVQFIKKILMLPMILLSKLLEIFTGKDKPSTESLEHSQAKLAAVDKAIKAEEIEDTDIPDQSIIESEADDAESALITKNDLQALATGGIRKLEKSLTTAALSEKYDRIFSDPIMREWLETTALETYNLPGITEEFIKAVTVRKLQQGLKRKCSDITRQVDKQGVEAFMSQPDNLNNLAYLYLFSRSLDEDPQIQLLDLPGNQTFKAVIENTCSKVNETLLDFTGDVWFVKASAIQHLSDITRKAQQNFEAFQTQLMQDPAVKEPFISAIMNMDQDKLVAHYTGKTHGKRDIQTRLIPLLPKSLQVPNLQEGLDARAEFFKNATTPAGPGRKSQKTFNA